MKILITGVSGFIGGAIYKFLDSPEHSVYGISGRKGGLTASEMQKLEAVDISDIHAINRIATEMPACDAIIHAAAVTNKDNFSNSIVHANCLGIQNILWLAEQWNTSHFVFLSGTHIIGAPIDTTVTEDDPARPLSTYHLSKLFGENLVSILANNRNYFSLRLSAPIGVGMPRNRLLSTIIRKALANEAIELAGQGGRKQNYIDIRDIARATSLCLQKNNSGIFNIAGSCSISNLSLAKRCIEFCGSNSEIVFTGQADPEETVDWNISIDKAKNQLGYIPHFSIDDTVASIVAAYSINAMSV